MVYTKLLNLATFELEAFPIGQMPPYIAASHVWSENLFPVTKIGSVKETLGLQMLSTALTGNYPWADVHYCWIDTWCIDQNDPEDKLRQLPLMGDIYEKATCVIITVLHSFSFSQEDWDSSVSTCDEILEVQRLPGDEYHASSRRMGSLTIPAVKALFKAYAMMLELASLPWGTRVWTAQEYVLAKSEVWIGIDQRPIRVKVSDMTTIFAVRWTREVILRMFESYIGVPQDFSPAAEEAAENLDLMNRIKEGRVAAVESMLLAGPRKCKFPADAIYGLMAASRIVFTPSRSETLESAWRRWWEQSLNSGKLYFALLPVLEFDNTTVASNSWNCVMPPCERRCELGSKTLTHKADSWGDLNVHDGTISVVGRVAGKCQVDMYLCENEIPSDVEGLSKLCGHDEELALRVCIAMDMGQYSRTQATTAAQAICATFRLANNAGGLSQEELERLQSLSDSFEPPQFRSQCYTKIYLGHMENTLMKTDCLIITGEQLPDKGELLALDLIKRTDREHVLKQLMVVLVQNDKSLPMHKIGMTYPLALHETRKSMEDCCCCGHVQCEPFQRFTIGGSACEYCTNRRHLLTAPMLR